VMSAPVDGSAAPVQLRDEEFETMTSDGTRLFLALPITGPLLRCTLPACTDDKYDATTAHRRMVFDGAVLSRGSLYDDAGDSTRAIVRVNADTMSSNALVTYSQFGVDDAYSLSARGGFLAWAEPKGRVRGCTHAACTPLDFAPEGGRQSSQSVATDGKRVYFTEGATGSTIVACPIAGCTTKETIASGQTFADDLHVDGGYLYWTINFSDAALLVRCPTTGCGTENPLPILAPQGTLGSIAFDDTFIYWIETSGTSGGSVWRTTK
jgi:hypothetical protein